MQITKERFFIADSGVELPFQPAALLSGAFCYVITAS
jgi:hypothetical protein